MRSSLAQAVVPTQADARTRTGDPFITSEVLYQLSYVGESAGDRIGPPWGSGVRPALAARVRARSGLGYSSSSCHHGTVTRSMIPTAANIATPITASTTTTAKTSAVRACEL